MWWIRRRSYTAATGSARRGSLRIRLSPLAPSPQVLRCAACEPRCPARHPATWRCYKNGETCRRCSSGRIAKRHRFPRYNQMFNLLCQQQCSYIPPQLPIRKDHSIWWCRCLQWITFIIRKHISPGRHWLVSEKSITEGDVTIIPSSSSSVAKEVLGNNATFLKVVLRLKFRGCSPLYKK